jgi:hypothetical protein
MGCCCFTATTTGTKGESEATRGQLPVLYVAPWCCLCVVEVRDCRVTTLTKSNMANPTKYPNIKYTTLLFCYVDWPSSPSPLALLLHTCTHATHPRHVLTTRVIFEINGLASRARLRLEISVRGFEEEISFQIASAPDGSTHTQPTRATRWLPPCGPPRIPARQRLTRSIPLMPITTQTRLGHRRPTTLKAPAAGPSHRREKRPGRLRSHAVLGLSSPSPLLGWSPGHFRGHY